MSMSKVQRCMPDLVISKISRSLVESRLVHAWNRSAVEG
jgi:hypothetical protein